MEMRHMRYFVAMAEAGSLMKAAERLRVAQPALSVHLSNLEADLGVKLVRRSNRGIELTEEGHLLYERAIELIDHHQEVISSIKQRKIKPSGSVSLGLPSTMPSMVTAPLYRAMRAELPDVSLYILDASTAALYQWLQESKIDLAVLFSLPDNKEYDITPLYTEDFCLVGGPDFAGKSTITFEELFDYPLIMPCSATSWRKILDAAAERLGRPLSSPIETESFSALKAAAQSGDCYAIMPRTSVHEEIQRGELFARRIVSPDIRGMKALVQISGKVMTAAQREVGKLVARIIIETVSNMSFGGSASRSEGLSQMSPTPIFSSRRPRWAPNGSPLQQ